MRLTLKTELSALTKMGIMLKNKNLLFKIIFFSSSDYGLLTFFTFLSPKHLIKGQLFHFEEVLKFQNETVLINSIKANR